VAAAANLAARLGYETSAMDLGLAGPAQARRAYPGPVILVGAGAVDAAGVAGGGAALLAVSAYLSGRYPGVWAPDGVVWREAAENSDPAPGDDE